jgi:hypothetical protein
MNLFPYKFKVRMLKRRHTLRELLRDAEIPTRFCLYYLFDSLEIIVLLYYPLSYLGNNSLTISRVLFSSPP